jgi:hypothetical protein
LSEDEAVEGADAAAGVDEAAGVAGVVAVAVSDFVDVPAALPFESPEDLGLALP